MTKPKSKTFREIMQMEFPENEQVRLLKKPYAIRFTLDCFHGDIHLSELQNEADVLSWLYWLIGKEWMTVPVLERFLKLVAREKGIDLWFGESEVPPPPVRWLKTLDWWFAKGHPEITVKQFATLEGITERRAQERLAFLVGVSRVLVVSRTEGKKKFYSKRRDFPA
jgi:hypothetical protein